MFTGQLSWTDASDRATQLAPRPMLSIEMAPELRSRSYLQRFLPLQTNLAMRPANPGSPRSSTTTAATSLASRPAFGSRLLSLSSAACLMLPAQMMNNSVTVPDVDPNRTAPNLAAGLNREKLASWMDAHALAYSSHHCALFCRLGMEAAGMSTADRPLSGDAADYGPFLLRHGAHVVPLNSYTPQVGDTVIFDKTAQHPNGHMEMYDGHHWVSDFMQHSFSPYRDAASTPSFTIYRLT